MKIKNPIIKGTLILTFTGIISRFIGFFYRIFLSNQIGAEGMGIYQLISPVYSICFALTTSAIQTSISKFIAEKMSSKKYEEAKDILMIGLSLSVSLSIFAGLFLLRFAVPISSNILGDGRCAPLIRLLAIALPLSSIHSCICGYYYGLKQTAVPAISQLVEQVIRVFSVYLICSIILESGHKITPTVAAYGITFGEAGSMFFCITSISFRARAEKWRHASLSMPLIHLKNIIFLSLPLMLNRLFINLLQSIEAILIPSRLRMNGLSQADALSIYGILTGMSLPFILFPSALTNSVSVMLLPTVAEADATHNSRTLNRVISKTVIFSLSLGIFFTLFFLFTGKLLGNLVFHNEMAGKFILILSWICPFLYLSTTLGSILHGLGKTNITFFNNLSGLSIRILFVLVLIPQFGIIAYLWGLLVSQLSICLLNLAAVKRITISGSLGKTS